jgi:hypothetical protein
MHSSLDIKKNNFSLHKDGEDNSPIVTAFPRDELKNFAPGSLLMSFFSSFFFSKHTLHNFFFLK